MSLLIPIALIGWFPITLVLFSCMQPQRAMLTSLLGAWLFLPVASFPLPGMPDFDKAFVTCLAPLLGSVIFDIETLKSFRPRWWDTPMLVWCLVPLASSISNDLGVYDGAATAFRHCVLWGIPYVLGRSYFAELAAALELAVAVGIGGLLYIIPCLIEIRLSPILHLWVYGVARSWGGMRYGGYRPAVFMQNGLELGLWMSATTLLILCLWIGKNRDRIGRLPIATAAICISVTTLLCKSTGALSLLLVGILALITARKFHSSIPLICLAAAIPLYAVSRSTNMWDGSAQVRWIAENIDADRAQSFEFRLQNEDLLAARALERPLFGWAGWGRARVFDNNGNDLTITDGLWIIALGNHGIVGLAGLLGIFLAPVAAFVQYARRDVWATSAIVPVIGLVIVVLLYGIDNLMNAMLNPVYVLSAGAVVGILTSHPRESELFRIYKERLLKLRLPPSGRVACRVTN